MWKWVQQRRNGVEETNGGIRGCAPDHLEVELDRQLIPVRLKNPDAEVTHPARRSPHHHRRHPRVPARTPARVKVPVGPVAAHDPASGRKPSTLNAERFARIKCQIKLRPVKCRLHRVQPISTNYSRPLRHLLELFHLRLPIILPCGKSRRRSHVTLPRRLPLATGTSIMTNVTIIIMSNITMRTTCIPQQQLKFLLD